MFDDYKLSIIICTYNRSAILEETLASYSRLNVPEDLRVELLLIDNRSTDKTASIIHEFIAKYPDNTRYFYESLQGLSHARNRGIAESRGSLISFVDDDVFFDDDWLTGIVKVFDSQPTAMAMGGRSIPLFEGGRPPWIDETFFPLYGDTMFGDTARWLSFPEHPFGLNMTFRREVFQKVGRFNVNLGRIKNSLLSNEESDLFRRLSESSLPVYYSPSAKLYHRIPKSRLQQDWILKRYYWQGRSEVVQQHSNSPPSLASLLTQSVKSARQLITSATGGHLSPRRAYWHYSKLSLQAKAGLAHRLGEAQQNLFSMFSL